MGKQKKCNKCGLEKSEDEFYKSQRGNTCKQCFLQQTRDYKRNCRKNPEFRQLESKKQKERRVRLWQNTLLHDSKYRGFENTLTLSDIDEMFKKQNGLCYWYKVPLVVSQNKKHPQQPSLDRLDRNLGYIKGNVVLSSYSANIGRNENDIETWTNFLELLLNRK